MQDVSIVLDKYNKISKNVKVAFFTTLIFGFIVHIAFFSETFVNGDSIRTLFYMGDQLHQAKWFSEPLFFMRGYYNSSGIIGVLTIFYLAISAGLLVSILKINNKIFSGLVGAILVSFPSIMAMMSFRIVDYYIFAFMIALLGVFFTVKYKKGYILGIILLTLSLGTYMAFIGVAAVVFVLTCIYDLIYKNMPSKKVIINLIKYISIVLISCLLYYIILQLVLEIRNAELSNYRDIDKIGQFTLESVGASFAASYSNFFNFLFVNPGLMSNLRFGAINIVTGILILLLYVIGIIKSRIYKNALKLLVSIILMALIPVSVNLIIILSQTATLHWIIGYSIVMVYIIPLFFAEHNKSICESESEGMQNIEVQGNAKCNLKWTNFSRLTAWIVLVMAIITALTSAKDTNNGYMAMEFANKKNLSLAIRVADDLTGTEGYTVKTPVSFVFEEWTAIDNSEVFNKMRVIDGVQPGFMIADDDYMLYSFAFICREFLGFNLIQQLYMQRDLPLEVMVQTESMPRFPNNGYIKNIDGFIIVKM